MQTRRGQRGSHMNWHAFKHTQPSCQPTRGKRDAQITRRTEGLWCHCLLNILYTWYFPCDTVFQRETFLLLKTKVQKVKEKILEILLFYKYTVSPLASVKLSTCLSKSHGHPNKIIASSLVFIWTVKGSKYPWNIDYGPREPGECFCFSWQQHEKNPLSFGCLW